MSYVGVWPAAVPRVHEAQHHEEAFEDSGGCRADGWDLNLDFFTFDDTNVLFLQHGSQAFLSQWKTSEKNSAADYQKDILHRTRTCKMYVLFVFGINFLIMHNATTVENTVRYRVFLLESLKINQHIWHYL